MPRKKPPVNLWFRPVSLGGRKSCPTCYAKVRPNEELHSWVEYVNGKARLVDHFCRSCFGRIVLHKVMYDYGYATYPLTWEGRELVWHGLPVWAKVKVGPVRLQTPDGESIEFVQNCDLGIIADWCDEHGHPHADEYRKWSHPLKVGV